MSIWIGTSGWSYDHWHPELYPAGLPARDRLAQYTKAFVTAELTSSFYRWPGPAAFASWRDRLPDGFRLSVKAPRGLTLHRRAGYAATSGSPTPVVLRMPRPSRNPMTRETTTLGRHPEVPGQRQEVGGRSA